MLEKVYLNEVSSHCFGNRYCLFVVPPGYHSCRG